MPRTISITSNALSPDLREAARLASQLSFDAVQLPLSVPGLSLAELSRTGQRELVKTITSVNLAISSLATSAGRAGLMPGADVDRALDHLEKALRTAADLASLGQNVVLCVDLGPLPPPPAEVATPRKAVDPAALGALILPEPVAAPVAPTPAVPRDLVAEAALDGALIELGRRADRYGVPLALRSELGALASIHRAMDAARCPLFFLDLDPVAVLRDEWDLEQTLAGFAGRIAHVRARDARKGTQSRTQPVPLGQGDARVSEVLRSLDDAHYPGPVTLDPTELPNRQQEARSGLAYLRSQIT
jgi:sugar phosphate isomerase/epimerase